MLKNNEKHAIELGPSVSVPWIFAGETAVIQDDPSTLCLYRNENSHQSSTVPTISKTHGRMEASKLPSAKDGEQRQIEKNIIIRVLGKRERERERDTWIKDD